MNETRKSCQTFVHLIMVILLVNSPEFTESTFFLGVNDIFKNIIITKFNP